MILKRLNADGLTHNTYFIGSKDDAVVIDPRREKGDIDELIDIAHNEGLSIIHVLETHRNEDFLIGSLEVKNATGAKIGHGAKMPFKYGDMVLKEGDTISFGKMMLKVLETPGHTPDSLTYALYEKDHPGTALAAFTGDALFIGSTGRTDLHGIEESEVNAAALFDSIHEKILPLGDGVLLYPAHGAGSVCGEGIGDRDESTLGYEKRTNPHLSLDRSAFIEKKMAEKHVRPPYFLKMEEYNLAGPPLLSGRMNIKGLRLKDFIEAMNDKNTAIADTRKPQAFSGGHIPDAFNVWLEGIAIFPGWLFNYDQRLVLVNYYDADATTADRYLARIGYDNVYGYLIGGFDTWQNAGMPITYTGALSASQLKAWMGSGEVTVIDVRAPEEWENGIIPGSIFTYVGHLQNHLPDIPKDKPIASMCSVGNRSSIGASILQRAGYRNVYNVLGGFTAWKNNGYGSVKPGSRQASPVEASA